MKARLDYGDIEHHGEFLVFGNEGGKHPCGLAVVGDAAREMGGSCADGHCAHLYDQARDSQHSPSHHSGTSQHGSRMSRAVEILTLQQFEAAGGLADGYAFEDFSCPLNGEIEKFLREKAVQSTHLGSSVTYLVYDKQTSALLGYFTLMLKPFSIAKSMISKTKCRMLERVTREDNGNFTTAVYLIAQIGKNFALDERLRIRGDELLKLAFEKLYAAKDYVGGKFVLVERDVKSPELLKFYSRWNFQSWNERYDDRDKITYDQMLCVLRSESADEPFQPSTSNGRPCIVRQS